MLRHLLANAIVVFQDEGDVNTNPKIGSMWMPRGQLPQGETPGTNRKCYQVGSRNWRMGELSLTEGSTRNVDVFLAHLDYLHAALSAISRHAGDLCQWLVSSV